jgi:hypothetical protein
MGGTKGREVLPGNCNQMTGDGETVTPLLPEPGVWTGMGIGQCLGAVEVEARENPSGLAAPNSRAASRSRIYVSSCDCCTRSSQPVAIGRGPYTSTHDPKRRFSAPVLAAGANPLGGARR